MYWYEFVLIMAPMVLAAAVLGALGNWGRRND